jgi:chemotaxis protein methyltransferase CheR
MTLVTEYAVPGLTDAEFAQFQRLIHQRAGIFLSDGKRALLVGRLARRMRELGLPSFGAYYAAVQAGGPAELTRLLDAVCTNETHFFREGAQFDLLRGRVCGEWLGEEEAGRRGRTAKVWSAACSTGEEPYSIAMVLEDRLGRLGWGIDILATDLSTKVLDQAGAGVWRADKASPIPESYLKSYMLKGVGPEEGKVKAGAVIRSRIRFAQVNLRDAEWPVRERFDAIFVRNVLIYFDAPTRHEVLRRLVSHLYPGGYLFLGHAEGMAGAALPLKSVMPAVYRVSATTAGRAA